MTSGKTKLWFEFQKVHYIYDDEEKKQFRAVEFNTNRPMEFYQESKGLETEVLIQEAIDEYGDNQWGFIRTIYICISFKLNVYKFERENKL